MSFLLFFTLVLTLTQIASGWWFTKTKMADDILLTNDQYDWLYSKKLDRTGKSSPILTWPNKIVPYKFDKNFDSMGREKIEKYFKKISSVSCVKFENVENSNTKDFLKISEKSSYCYGSLGYNKDSKNELTIGRQWMFEHAIGHEIMHVLGFGHQHVDPGRDKYIDVIWKNIKKGFEGNFEKYADGVSFGDKYDFFSIMHSSLKAASIDGTLTMVPKDSSIDSSKVASSDFLSKIDIEKLNKLYKC